MRSERITDGKRGNGDKRGGSVRDREGVCVCGSGGRREDICVWVNVCFAYVCGVEYECGCVFGMCVYLLECAFGFLDLCVGFFCFCVCALTLKRACIFSTVSKRQSFLYYSTLFKSQNSLKPFAFRALRALSNYL